MPDRSHDWLRQAGRDFEQAEDSRRAGRHEWACFAAQQASEKAVRALHLALGQKAWGHSVARLLTELPAGSGVTESLVEMARTLGPFYAGPRYPDGFPEGAPFEHYGPLQSEQALAYAREILAFVRTQMA
jgi:HEPN domain-containing protein